MKVEFVTTEGIKKGSGMGVIEYTYNLYANIARSKGVEVHQLYAFEDYRRFHSELSINLGFGRRVVKDCNSVNPDLVHLTDQNLGAVVRSLKKAKQQMPIVTTVHDLEIFRIISGELGFPVIYKVYSALTAGNVDYSVLNSDFLIFDSVQTRREVRERYGRTGKQVVVPLGVNDAFLRGVAHARPKADDYRIGYLGALQSNKHVSFLVDAAGHLSKAFKVLIYGSGIEYQGLMARAAGNKIQNIFFKGFAPEHEKRQIYDSFDAFAFPSLHEGFGLPILEA